MAYALALALISGLAGFLGGLTGTGGIIIPPVLMSVFGEPPAVAMGSAQASYVIPSSLAVLMFFRRGQFEWRTALPMAISGCTASFLSAAFLKPLVNSAVLTIFFALCMIISGAVMFKKPGGPAVGLPPARRVPALILLGSSVGLLAGVTGSGSNAILVPAMVFMGLDMLVVLAACQFFSVLSSSAGTLGNVLNGAVNFHDVLWLTAGQIIGIWLGVRLAQRINTGKLKLGVGAVCLTCGLVLAASAVIETLGP
ncbi:hypothetical protein C4J81_12060 [Deltaproteobacteria bacterium Smac51]|nr:hypothetical protein C4J81_12060 [Deltaproteobacteria bacterium Smac51]